MQQKNRLSSPGYAGALLPWLTLRPRQGIVSTLEQAAVQSRHRHPAMHLSEPRATIISRSLVTKVRAL